MIRGAATLLGFLLLAGSYGAQIRYFSNVRDVLVSASEKQNYVVLDAETWRNARPDLADIRLYDGSTQVPYVLEEQNRRSMSTEQPAKIVNLGRAGDHTEFDLEITGIAQYDRIRLQLDAKDFVASALLFGENRLNQRRKAQLGPSTLYDFSRERLGSHFVLQLPRSSFPYLHVQLTAGLRPEQVKGAVVFDVQEKQPKWTNVGSCTDPVQQAGKTVTSCQLPPGVPLERVQFVISPEQVNFRRTVSVSAGRDQIVEGNLTRVHMSRGGTQVVSEQTAIEVPGYTDKRNITVAIANGDDSPLRLLAVQPQALERRIYFDPAGRTVLKMYYGDPNLYAPVYDFAKFFQEDPVATQAQLGADMHNAEYTGRPDGRPWSERHKALLWAAMLLAVAVLAVLALRGLWPPPSPQA